MEAAELTHRSYLDHYFFWVLACSACAVASWLLLLAVYERNLWTVVGVFWWSPIMMGPFVLIMAGLAVALEWGIQRLTGPSSSGLITALAAGAAAGPLLFGVLGIWELASFPPVILSGLAAGLLAERRLSFTDPQWWLVVVMVSVAGLVLTHFHPLGFDFF